jgi:hypothetical protein
MKAAVFEIGGRVSIAQLPPATNQRLPSGSSTLFFKRGGLLPIRMFEASSGISQDLMSRLEA